MTKKAREKTARADDMKAGLIITEIYISQRGRPQEMTILFLFGLIIIVVFFNVPALLYIF